MEQLHHNGILKKQKGSRNERFAKTNRKKKSDRRSARNEAKYSKSQYKMKKKTSLDHDHSYTEENSTSTGYKSQSSSQSELTKATTSLKKLISERKAHDKSARKKILKKQTPCLSARTKSKSFDKQCKKPYSINDIYEKKMASPEPTQKPTEPPHPEKINRLYKRHKLLNEWKQKYRPSHCRTCLKDKWKSNVHRRQKTKHIYQKKHRSGKFLTREKSERSK